MQDDGRRLRTKTIGLQQKLLMGTNNGIRKEWTEMPSQSEMSMQSANEEIESLIKHIKEVTVNRPDWDLSWTKRAKDMIVDLEAQDFVLNYCLSRRKTVFPESADRSKQARRSGDCPLPL